MTNVLGGFTNTYVGATFRLSTDFFLNGQKTIFNCFGNTNDQRWRRSTPEPFGERALEIQLHLRRSRADCDLDPAD